MQLVSSIYTIAGTGTAGFSGDGGAATSAKVSSPVGICFDTSGNLYFSDTVNNRVRKITTSTGIITTVAGTGTPGSTGLGGAATSALLSGPTGVVIDASGNLLVADTTNNRVLKIVTATGIISAFAGNGTVGFLGDGGQATSANLNNPTGIAVDGSGNLFIADTSNSKIRKVTAATGVISTFAGTGITGYSGDNGAATLASINGPYGVATDTTGNVYIADTGNNRVRKVTISSGNISTVAGAGTATYSGDGGQATTATISAPYALVLDNGNNIFIADRGNNRIRKVTVATGVISTVAGTGVAGYNGEGTAAFSAQLSSPGGITMDNTGTVFFDDTLNQRVRKFGSHTNFPITSVGGSTPAQIIQLQTTAAEKISSIAAVTSQGGISEIAISSITGCTVDGTTTVPINTVCTVTANFTPGYPGRRLIPLQTVTSTGTVNVGLTGIGLAPLVGIAPGTISAFAGTGTASYTGDSAAATSATLNSPAQTAMDIAGNLYIADQANNVVRKVTATTGIISTVAGTGTAGFSGDGGAAISAKLSSPRAVVVDMANNLYIADYGNNRVRKVNLVTGIITTYAGTGTASSTGDNGLATAATINGPDGLAVDLYSDIYIAEAGGNRVRRVNGVALTITTAAGTGTAGYSGDGALATSAKLSAPAGLAIDVVGNLYIADFGNSAVRLVIAVSSTISTIAGTGVSGFSGDGAIGTSAKLAGPNALALDGAGSLYIADSGNNRIRRLEISNSFINTIAGNGSTGSTGNAGGATSAPLSTPMGIALDATGNLFITAQAGNQIRKVSGGGPLAFSTSTNYGTADSVDNPLSAKVENIGNVPLTVAVPSSGTNAAITTGFVLDGTTTCPQLTTASSAATLASGISCLYAVNFNPQSIGAVTGTVTLTDNALYSTGSTQTISLSGTGLAVGTSTVVSSSASSAGFGTSVTFTATVAPVSGTGVPVGTVQFSIDGSAAGGAVTLSGGAGTYTTSSLAVGTHSVTAVYTVSSTNFTGSTSSAFTETITQLTPSVTLATSNASVMYGTSVTFTATLPAGATGTVTFKRSGTTIGTGTISSGTATFSTSTLPLGTLSITASYGGDTNYVAASSTALTQTVTQATGTISVATSSASVTYGTSITFTATVASSATGTVTFKSGSTTLGTGTASSGTAAYSTSSLAAGSYSITAVYGGDTNYTTATSTALTQTVTQATGTISLTTTSASVTYGTLITFTTTVASSATGTVTFKSGSTTLGTGTVNSGTATYSTSSLTVGSYSITAVYSGDTNYTTATSTALTQTVTKAPVTVAIASSINPSKYGDSVTLTVTFTGVSTVPTGTAVLKDSAITLGTLTLNASGVATYSSSALVAGSHSLTVSYNGDTNYN